MTTAAELLATGDSTFLAFLREWEREKRVGLPLVDYLLELGLASQAEAVRWAATEEDRPEWSTRALEVLTGPCPCLVADHYWVWYWGNLPDPDYPYADCLKPERVGAVYDPNGPSGEWAPNFQTFSDAIVFLLDRWVPEPAEITL